MNSRHPDPRRVLGRCRAAVRGPDPVDPGDPRMRSFFAFPGACSRERSCNPFATRLPGASSQQPRSQELAPGNAWMLRAIVIFSTISIIIVIVVITFIIPSPYIYKLPINRPRRPLCYNNAHSIIGSLDNRTARRSGAGTKQSMRNLWGG